MLVEGKPWTNIADIHRVRRVLLAGKELDLAALANDVASPELTPMNAQPTPELLDDFEQSRSRIDTLWINNTDSGHDHSQMSYARTKRTDGSQALTVLCNASEKNSPLCSMVLPLAKGSVEPVDASSFKGVSFEARGEASYFLQIPTRSVRDRNYFRSDFQRRSRLEEDSRSVDRAPARRRRFRDTVDRNGSPQSRISDCQAGW